MAKKGLVVFDLDGTLVDSKKVFHAAIHDYSAQNGLPPPDMTVVLRGYAAPDKHDFGWGVSREDQILHFKKAAFMFDNPVSYKAYTPGLFPNVHETLSGLSSDYVLAVATARPMTAVTHIFDVNKIGSYFSAVRSHDDFRNRGLKEKPEPDMLLDIIREVGVNPGRTYMVGDTVMDMRMAHAAQVHSVAVGWGWHLPDALRAENPRHMLMQDISGLNAVLRSSRQPKPPRHP
jgi:phosphoglycolate phosphatase